MRTIKIFLASSAELQPDRIAFETFLYQKSLEWLPQRNMLLELVKWENFLDAVSESGLQSTYNDAIRNAQIFVMLFWTKVGKYTEEEFDVALKAFKQNEKKEPLIYTYFKDTAPAENRDPSLDRFMTKLEGMGHYKTVYQTPEGLQLHFGRQLDKLFAPTTNMPGPAPDITKAALLDMIGQGDLYAAFDKMTQYFGNKNDTFNTMVNEFINPPIGFNMPGFLMRFRVFVNQKWPA
jgi:hypothetical protein